MSYIRQVAIDQAEGLLASIYESAESRAGYVANIIRVMSLDPDACQASMVFYMKLMKGQHVLEPADREMLATVVSCANECYY